MKRSALLRPGMDCELMDPEFDDEALPFVVGPQGTTLLVYGNGETGIHVDPLEPDDLRALNDERE